MSKVITFSTKFPAHHPRAGEPTEFVEKIWESLYPEIVGWPGFNNLSRQFNVGLNNIYKPKHHTIRSGTRWKVGDKFSPRVWSGRPYNSPQIIIGPDIDIRKVWDIEINYRGGAAWFEVVIDGEIYGQTHNGYDRDRNKRGLELLAEADGLSLDDLKAWFNEPLFKGQIICWNDKITY